MNKEFKQNILKAIKNNTVRVTYLDDTHYTFTLFGKKDKVLMTVDCYDDTIPRINIDINGEHVAHINHFAKTDEQLKDNYDVTMIANRMFLKNAQQSGRTVILTTMDRKQFLLSRFLQKNSIKRKQK